MDRAIDKPSETSNLLQNQQDGFWQPTVSPDGPKFMWVKRPGLTVYKTVGSTSSYGIRGLWGFVDNNGTKIVIAVNSNGDVWRVGTESNTDLTGTSDLTGSKQPYSLVALEGKIYIASNYSDEINEFTTTAASGIEVADADAPDSSCGIALINSVLVSQKINSSRFDWSNAGNGSAWTGLYANTEFQQGLTYRLMSANGFLYFFRSNYIEIWRDDGASFTRETVVNIGAFRATCIIEVDGIFYFLGEDFQVYKLDGFNVSSISSPEISNWFEYAHMTSGYTLEMTYLPILGKKFIIFRYSAGPSPVFDIDLNQWYQWGTWNSESGIYDPYKCYAITKTPSDYLRVLAGDYSTYNVYSVTGTTDNGTAIRSVIRTDFIDRGAPDSFKYCHELILVLKRANIASGTPKTISISYRDDGSTTWSTAITANIEAVSTTDYKVNIQRLGRYKRRMWRFVMIDESSAGLYGAYERFEIGR